MSWAHMFEVTETAACPHGHVTPVALYESMFEKDGLTSIASWGQKAHSVSSRAPRSCTNTV
eukprot:4605325-Amphidinium_carterae.1